MSQIDGLEIFLVETSAVISAETRLLVFEKILDPIRQFYKSWGVDNVFVINPVDI